MGAPGLCRYRYTLPVMALPHGRSAGGPQRRCWSRGGGRGDDWKSVVALYRLFPGWRSQVCSHRTLLFPLACCAASIIGHRGSRVPHNVRSAKLAKSLVTPITNFRITPPSPTVSWPEVAGRMASLGFLLKARGKRCHHQKPSRTKYPAVRLRG